MRDRQKRTPQQADVTIYDNQPGAAEHWLSANRRVRKAPRRTSSDTLHSGSSEIPKPNLTNSLMESGLVVLHHYLGLEADLHAEPPDGRFAHHRPLIQNER
jgi:hypothetical protein